MKKRKPHKKKERDKNEVSIEQGSSFNSVGIDPPTREAIFEFS